jgi:hypothetical protein
VISRYPYLEFDDLKELYKSIEKTITKKKLVEHEFKTEREA